MVQAPQTGERLLACTLQQALALPCPTGTWSQTLMPHFAEYLEQWEEVLGERTIKS